MIKNKRNALGHVLVPRDKTTEPDKKKEETEAQKREKLLKQLDPLRAAQATPAATAGSATPPTGAAVAPAASPASAVVTPVSAAGHSAGSPGMSAAPAPAPSGGVTTLFGTVRKEQEPEPENASLSSAEWFPDPTGRHEMRYYDGTAWTEHVSDAGAASSDPLET